MSNKRLHALVYGRVQGVGYRYFAKQQALNNGLKGWARNRKDRTVEILAEGNRQELEIFLSKLHEGPPASEVTKITTSWLPANGEFSHFKIRRTA